MRAALVHDLHEVEAGDVPYPFKQLNPTVRGAYIDQEREFNEINGCYVDLNEEQYAILRWADMFELLLFAVREHNMGNLKMGKTINVAQDALGKMGFPNNAAETLWREFHG